MKLRHIGLILAVSLSVPPTAFAAAQKICALGKDFKPIYTSSNEFTSSFREDYPLFSNIAKSVKAGSPAIEPGGQYKIIGYEKTGYNTALVVIQDGNGKAFATDASWLTAGSSWLNTIAINMDSTNACNGDTANVSHAIESYDSSIVGFPKPQQVALFDDKMGISVCHSVKPFRVVETGNYDMNKSWIATDIGVQVDQGKGGPGVSPLDLGADGKSYSPASAGYGTINLFVKLQKADGKASYISWSYLSKESGAQIKGLLSQGLCQPTDKAEAVSFTNDMDMTGKHLSTAAPAKGADPYLIVPVAGASAAK